MPVYNESEISSDTPFSNHRCIPNRISYYMFAYSFVRRDLPQDIGTVLVQTLEYVLGHIPGQTPGRAQSCVIW